MIPRPGKAVLVILCAWPLFFLGVPAQAYSIQEIRDSIQRGVKYIYSQQDSSKGYFEVVPMAMQGGGRNSVHAGQWGGLTSLAVYALLSAGENPHKEPRLALAGDWLKEHEFPGTYAESLRAMTWPKFPDSSAGGYHEAANRDGKLIVNALKLNGPPAGLTGYYTNANFVGEAADAGWGDHSSSLYDVLAAHALDGMGIEIPDEFWRRVDDRWRHDQQRDGGWCYKDFAAQGFMEPGFLMETMNMSASGVAVLFICQEHLYPGAGCDGTINDKQIEAGLAWIDKHYQEATATNSHGEFTMSNYSMYAVERVGLLSGRKYFAGTRDWYKDGAQQVIANQAPDGSWNGNLVDTCFGVLFLHHGLAPVVVNKLQYNGNWNERRQDAMHVADYMANALESDMTWQSVTLKVPTSDLHESPILYIAGKGDLAFSPEEMAKLKQFVEEGGTILGNSDCADAAFTKSFQKLGATLFPDFEWEKISPAHPILADQQFKASTWHTKPDLLGLSNGVRELMLLIPTSDPSKAWQEERYRSKNEAFELIADIYSYCIDRDQSWLRTETYVVPGPGGIADPPPGPAPATAPASAPVAPRPAINPGFLVGPAGDPNPHPAANAPAANAAVAGIRVARLKYNGLWNPEPGGWRQLSNILAARGAGGINAHPVELGKGLLAPFRVAHMTGVGRFKLSDAQKIELKTFIAAGGTLIMDSAGGNDGFVISARDLLAELFPEATLAELPPTSGVYGGVQVATMLRAAARRRFAGNVPPHGLIMGLTLGKRVAVYLSPQDLTEGLVGQPVAGINGFVPAAAAQIMTNLIYGHS